MTVIIVVGMDVLGKTWLCQHLARELGTTVRKVADNGDIDPSGRFRKSRLDWAAEEMSQWLRPDETFLYDRFPYPDERIYGYMPIGQVRAFEDALARTSDGDLTVVTVLPKDLGRYRLALSKSRDMHLLNLASTLYDNYVQFTETTRLNLLVHYVDPYCAEQELKETLEWLATLRLPQV